MDKPTLNNLELLKRLRIFFNDNPRQVTLDMIKDVERMGVGEDYAYASLLCNFLDLDDSFIDRYLVMMLKKEKVDKYINNPFYQKMNIAPTRVGRYDIDYHYIEDYELFKHDEIYEYFDGRLLPQIGYFDEALKCLSITTGERVVYQYNPYLVNALTLPIEEAKGSVYCFGLGIGYFAYMAHLKEDVKKVTIFEENKDLISLFNELILDKFDYKEKIKVVHASPLPYLKNKNNKISANYVFINCWKDLETGVREYPKYKKACDARSKMNVDYFLKTSIELYPKEEN